MFLLRELEKKDLTEINKWRNDPEVIKFLGAPYRYINLDVDERWFDTYMANRDRTIRCSIVVKETEMVIGLISLTDINYINQSASLHVMVGNIDNQGKGAGIFSVIKMLSHAFNNMNLQRIELTVLEDNERAIHLYEKVGFVREGIMRNAVFKNGSYKNMYIYSILKNEFCQHNM